MKTLVDHLSTYASYHRDRRNVATHFVGIPMIAVAVAALLARVSLFEVAGVSVSLASLATLATVAFYLRLEARFGAVMAAFMALNLWAGTAIAGQSSGVWLALGLGLFVVGWAFQFVGHFWEGRKPAFVDDISGLVIGPLFVVAELGFALGLRDEVREVIESRVGPLRVRAAAAG